MSTMQDQLNEKYPYNFRGEMNAEIGIPFEIIFYIYVGTLTTLALIMIGLLTNTYDVSHIDSIWVVLLSGLGNTILMLIPFWILFFIYFFVVIILLIGLELWESLYWIIWKIKRYHYKKELEGIEKNE